MTPDHKESFEKLFDYIYKSNAEAKALSFKVLEIAHTWDDLIDGDKPVCDADINNAFIGSIFEIQQSQLWIAAGMNHHVLNVFLKWRDATAIENDKERTIEDLEKCYMLRAGWYDLFVILAYHLFGSDWAAKIGVTVRRYYGETMKDYLKEMQDV